MLFLYLSLLISLSDVYAVHSAHDAAELVQCGGTPAHPQAPRPACVPRVWRRSPASQLPDAPGRVLPALRPTHRLQVSTASMSTRAAQHSGLLKPLARQAWSDGLREVAILAVMF